MKKLALALIALASFGSAASAASLTNSSYKTPQQAARAGGKYAFIKAQPWNKAGAVRITKAVDARGNSQKFEVRGLGQKKVVTVVKNAAGKWQAYIPNAKKFTPSTGYTP